MRLLHVALAILASTLSPCALAYRSETTGALQFVTSADQSSSSIVTKARELLSVDDYFRLRNDSIPRLYQLAHDDNLLVFLKAVWALDREKYPGLAWGLLAQPRVRIAFATYWGQYLRDTTNDQKGIRETRLYAQTYLHDPNHAVRGDAVGYLAALGNDTDIPVLVQICSTDVLEVALNAAMAIKQLRRRNSEAALKQCRDATRNTRVKEFVESLLPKT